MAYEYRSYGSIEEEREYLYTDYSKALTKGIARNLMNRYQLEAKKEIERHYYSELEFAYQEGDYWDIFSYNGLTQEDFDELKEKEIKVAIQESMERMKERRVAEAEKDLWHVDEAYFLAYDKTKIILRKDREVFLLEGRDFSDKEVIDIVKIKLGL